MPQVLGAGLADDQTRGKGWLVFQRLLVLLRGETKGSKIKGKMGIKAAGLGGQNNHQYEPGSHEICM